MNEKVLSYKDFIPYIEKMKIFMENKRKQGYRAMLDAKGLEYFIQKVFQVSEENN